MSRRRQSKSAAWRRRQEADVHVRAAREAGYRARSAYKLLEINKRYNILRRNAVVVDLGAAPGGWSQVAKADVGAGGRVVAVDLLPMQPLDAVHIVQGDFTEAAVQAQIIQLAGGAANVVISDMAPNLSGIIISDQANMQTLFDAAYAYCCQGGLKTGGSFLIKTFAGEMHSECCKALHPGFATVKIITPEATRKTSRECYLLARGFQGGDI